MQILLTKNEYNALLEQKELREMVQAGQLQDLCTQIANAMPVTRDWEPDKEPRPWGCILDEKRNPGYCDECPVAEICPYPHKGWSK